MPSTASSTNPVRELYAGDLFFPIQRAAEVLRAWRERTATAPDDATSICHILRLPPLPELPGPLRGGAFAILEAACLGDPGTAAELIGPLRRLGPERDTFAMIPASALGQLNMDPGQPASGEGGGAFLAGFPAAAIDALVAVAGPDAEKPPGSVEVRHLGGALARPIPGGGAQPSIDASCLPNAAGATPTPDLLGLVTPKYPQSRLPRSHASRAGDGQRSQKSCGSASTSIAEDSSRPAIGRSATHAGSPAAAMRRMTPACRRARCGTTDPNTSRSPSKP
jgi:hypothetical protein